jgi:hypothetical protein
LLENNQGSLKKDPKSIIYISEYPELQKKLLGNSSKKI